VQTVKTVSWGAFLRADPELARHVEERLGGGRVCYLATVRPDGWPRPLAWYKRPWLDGVVARPGQGNSLGMMRGRRQSPETDSKPDAPRSVPTRASAVWTALVAAAVVLIALIIFIAQNGHRVEVSFVSLHPRFPLGIALLVAAVGGSVVTLIAGTVRITQLRGVLRRHRREHPEPAAAAEPDALPDPPTTGQADARPDERSGA